VFFLRLIVAEGLGAVSLNAGTRGYLHGSSIKGERMAVAMSSHVHGGESLYAAGTFRLLQHWSWTYGTSTNELLPWVAVKSGFASALKAGRISRGNLANWVADQQPLDLPDEPVTNLCYRA